MAQLLVSMAAVALGRSICANLLRRWIREAQMPASRRIARSSSNVSDPSTKPLLWMAGAASALLGCVLGFPMLGKLFAFVTPSPAMLACGAFVVGLNWLWFESVKWWLRKPQDESGGKLTPGRVDARSASICRQSR